MKDTLWMRQHPKNVLRYFQIRRVKFKLIFNFIGINMKYYLKILL